MRRTVFLTFSLLALAVLAAISSGVYFVSDYVRTHSFTTGEMKTARYAFGTDQADIGPVQSIAVTAQMAAGTLTVGALPTDAPATQQVFVETQDNIVEADAQVAYAVDDGRGVLSVTQNTLRIIPDVRHGGNAKNHWEIRLAPAVPLSMTIEMAAGEITLDMAGLAVDALTVKLATGDGVIDLRNALPRPARVEINNNVGKFEVHLPPDIGVRLDAHSTVGEVTAPGLRYLEEEDFYVNDAYQPGAPTLHLQVNTNIGEVIVHTDSASANGTPPGDVPAEDGEFADEEE